MKGEQIEGLGAFHPSVLLHLIDGLIMSFFWKRQKELTYRPCDSFAAQPEVRTKLASVII